jgi:hypothetical protein
MKTATLLLTLVVVLSLAQEAVAQANYIVGRNDTVTIAGDSYGFDVISQIINR